MEHVLHAGLSFHVLLACSSTRLVRLSSSEILLDDFLSVTLGQCGNGKAGLLQSIWSGISEPFDGSQSLMIIAHPEVIDVPAPHHTGSGGNGCKYG